MLGLCWNRSEPNSLGFLDYFISLFSSRDPYLANLGVDATLLGEQQWLWLEQELLKPASVRIIASSLQVLHQSSGWAWAIFPVERERLFAVVRESHCESIGSKE